MTPRALALLLTAVPLANAATYTSQGQGYCLSSNDVVPPSTVDSSTTRSLVDASRKTRHNMAWMCTLMPRMQHTPHTHVAALLRYPV